MKKISAISLSVLAFSLCSSAVAGPLDRYYLLKQEKEQSQAQLAPTIMTRYFDQYIDHANPQFGTFKQRYYIDTSYAKGDDAPTFFYICGEATCYPSSLNGEIRTMAKKFGANLVALEHRYYGHSLPAKSFSTRDLHFLTTENALRDLDKFQYSMMAKMGWTGKWVAFGGSYPGSLSAYFRSTFPNEVVGALASSAPVRAKENFEEYDAHVTKVAGPKCADNMRQSYRLIENAIGDESRMNEYKKAFGVEGLRDDTDFLFLVADIGAAAVQYGYKDTFCNMLDDADSPLEGYTKFAKFFYMAWGIQDPMSLTIQGAESENPADYADGLGMRQWFYQSCTEYGYWQTANLDPEKSTRSTLVNKEYYDNVCKRLFGLNYSSNEGYINQMFYKPLQTHASNIYFTNGSTDPWSRLSMTKENGNATNPDLDYYVIEGAAHCNDLHAPRSTDSAALKLARTQLESLITKWLAE